MVLQDLVRDSILQLILIQQDISNTKYIDYVYI